MLCMEQDTFDYSGTAFISHTRSNFQCIAPQNGTIFLLPIEPFQQKQVFSPLEDAAINPGGKQQQKTQSTEERYFTGHKSHANNLRQIHANYSWGKPKFRLRYFTFFMRILKPFYHFVPKNLMGFCHFSNKNPFFPSTT